VWEKDLEAKGHPDRSVSLHETVGMKSSSISKSKDLIQNKKYKIKK
jgi:hypothetical protein